MLRRVDSARIEYNPGVFSGKGRMILVIGRRASQIGQRKVKKDVAARAHEQQQTFPVFLCSMDGKNYWQFQSKIYSDNDGLDAQQVHALLVTRIQREQQKVNRAVAMVTRGVYEPPSGRSVIPDDVKQFVWQRDGGRCRQCGSPHELQFDHIISVAMGGSNEAENLQLLCGPCNRAKGAALTSGR